MSALQKAPMTEAEYLAFERTAEIRHEYLNGHIYAMSGASRIHNLICTNIVAALHPQLQEPSCEIYQSDMRLNVAATGLYTYPDIIVVCGEPQFAQDVFDTLLNPVLIIEVLSPSTESYDRGRKFHHYRQLASLKEYVLVTQDTPRIERFSRQKNGIWEFMEVNALDATLPLNSIAGHLLLGDAYARVTFPDDPTEIV